MGVGVMVDIGTCSDMLVKLGKRAIAITMVAQKISIFFLLVLCI